MTDGRAPLIKRLREMGGYKAQVDLMAEAAAALEQAEAENEKLREERDAIERKEL